MKRVGSVMLIVGVLVVVLAIFGFFSYGRISAQGNLPDPNNPQAVWEYITKTNAYSEWGTWPDPQFEGYLQSGAPHTNVVRIFVNDVGQSVASKFPGEMPEGTIIAKNNYVGNSVDNPGNLDAVTIMYKVKGFNPDGGDWFWGKYKPDGSVDAAGKVASCAGCHRGIAGNRDGILRWGFEGEPAVASAAGSPAVAQVLQEMQQPQQMPETGGGVPYQSLLILAVVTGVMLVLAGYTLRRKAGTIRK